MSVSPQGTVFQQPTFDSLTEQKLAAVKNYALFQGNPIMEGATGGCARNKYIFADMDIQIPIAGKEDKGTIPTPVFIAEEESSCWCRCCCKGNQPFTGKIYHAGAPHAGRTACGFYEGHQYPLDKSQGAVFTMDRPGCCSEGVCGKCHPGCCVFAHICQNEMKVYPGDGSELDAGETGKVAPAGSWFGHSEVPCLGGKCTPTINMMNPGQTHENPWGVLEGPTCFGGCYDLFCDTPFFFSSQPGKSGDLAFLEKQKPEGCFQMCCAVCSDADQYKIEMRSDKLVGAQKAQILATAIQLDLLFFEQDQNFCEIEQTADGQGVVITITLCLWYCCGALYPVKCCCMLKGNGGG